MSQIYSITRKACRNFENSVRKSLVFSTLLTIFLYIEKIWLESSFKRIYPSTDFLKVLEKSRILRNHIFSPPLFIVAFSIFMVLAAVPVSWRLHLNIIIAFFFFLLFSMVIPRFFSVVHYVKFDSEDIRAIGVTLFLIGVLFFLITITVVGGVPILKPALRYFLNPKLTIPAFLMIPGTALISSHIINEMQRGLIERSSAKFRIMLISLTCIVLLALLGYRTPLVAVILIIVIMGYYSGLFGIWEVLGSFILAAMLILGIGYFRSVEEYSLSNLGPLDFLQMRAAFTMKILDLLSTLSGTTGVMHGDLTLSMIPGMGSGPRTLIGKLIFWRTGVTITPTLFGQMLVEFGTVGLALGMSILGFILGVGYRIMQKTGDSFYIMLYSLIMAYSLISVETGILDQAVVGYIIVAGIIYVYNIFKSR